MVPDRVRGRARLVATAGAAGLPAGGVAFAGLLAWQGTRYFAGRKAFAVGALLFGGALLGWSGSIMAGDGFEAMQRHLDVPTDWTERKSRRAMARVGSFGFGWMVGSALAASLAAALG